MYNGFRIISLCISKAGDERSLNNISQTMTASDSPDAFTEGIKKFNFYDTCIVLNNDCFDTNVNPAARSRKYSFDPVMQVLYDTNSPLAPFPLPINRKDIIPNIDWQLQKGKPFMVSASVGVCSVKASDFEFEAALKQSDEKMYIMKIGRPNRRRD